MFEYEYKRELKNGRYDINNCNDVIENTEKTICYRISEVINKDVNIYCEGDICKIYTVIELLPEEKQEVDIVISTHKACLAQ